MSDSCCEQFGNDGWDWFPVTPWPDQTDRDNLADWEIAETDHDLEDGNQLHSAVIIQLFTDKRLPDDRDYYETDTFERAGWWGDYFAPFEIGSHLWTLYRAALTDATIQDIERYIREALQPLINQGAAARLDIDVQVDKAAGFVLIIPTLYGKCGTKIYQQQFRRLWQ